MYHKERLAGHCLVLQGCLSCMDDSRTLPKFQRDDKDVYVVHGESQKGTKRSQDLMCSLGEDSPQEILSRILGFLSKLRPIQTSGLSRAFETRPIPCKTARRATGLKGILPQAAGLGNARLVPKALVSQKNWQKALPVPSRLLTFIRSMEASSLSCCTVLRAWAMLLVLAVLLDIVSYCLLKSEEKFVFKKMAGTVILRGPLNSAVLHDIGLSCK